MNSGTSIENQVAEDYKSALADLHINSKPLITMLTMLADENKMYASVITHVVGCHINETTYKLPAMYLVDSIVKNVGNDYKRLFGNSIATLFAAVFKEVDEKTRKKLYELRQTWNEVFPQSRLFLLDTNIHEIDPAWPITSQPRIGTQAPTIHVNPNKFKPHSLKTGVGGPLQTGIGKLASSSSMGATTVPEAPTPSNPSANDIEELKKVQTQKRVLEETRKKVEKMIESELAPTDVSGKLVDPSPSTVQASSDRRAFLRNFKIKKKSQSGDEKSDAPPPHSAKEKVSNIYIAPWKVQQILPGMTASPTSSRPPPSHKDHRPSHGPAHAHVPAPAHASAPIPVQVPVPAPLRDPRMAQQDISKNSRPVNASIDSAKPFRDPRLSTTRKGTPPTSRDRDPRLTSKPQEIATVAPKSSSVPAAPSRDPRVIQPEVRKHEKEKPKPEKDTKVRKEKEKPKEAPPPKKEKEKVNEKEKKEKMEKDKPNEKKIEKDKPNEKERAKSKEREKEKDKKKHHSSKTPSPLKESKEGKENISKVIVKEKEAKKERKDKSSLKSSGSSSDSASSTPSKGNSSRSSSIGRSSSTKSSSRSKHDSKETPPTVLPEKCKGKIEKDKGRISIPVHSAAKGIEDKGRISTTVHSATIGIEDKGRISTPVEPVPSAVMGIEDKGTISTPVHSVVKGIEDKGRISTAVHTATIGIEDKGRISTPVEPVPSAAKGIEDKGRISIPVHSADKGLEDKGRISAPVESVPSATIGIENQGRISIPVHSAAKGIEDKGRNSTAVHGAARGTDVSLGSIRTKRREHIRPRGVESPEEEAETKTPKLEALVSVTGGTDNASATTKKTKNNRASDSDDSDHYDGNKPPPTVYSNKKAKIEPSNPSLAPPSVPASNPFETPAIDTDLRQFTTPPNRHHSAVKPKDKLGDLFGKEDTDLRQLPARFPNPQSNPPAVLNPFLGKPDEDMRIKATPAKVLPEGDENRDPMLRGIVSSEKMKYIDSTPGTNVPQVAELRSKKPIFNSPHAAKWEKFREKNPEFREYERQASVCEKMEGIEENYPLDRESPSLMGKGHGRPSRPGDYRRLNKDDERSEFVDHRRAKSPTESESGDENYQYMIMQLQDQLGKGEISPNEFGTCMKNIRMMVEKRKIMELQAKERDSSAGSWRQERRPMESVTPGSGGIWAREFPNSREDERYQRNKGESKWIEAGGSPKSGPGWHRRDGGRGNDSSRGPESRPVTPGANQRFGDEWTGEPELPTIPEDVLRSVFRESETRTIDIDGKPREIRSYGEKAIILMDWDDPRLISFEPSQCNIVFDGGQFVITMAIGEDYREFMIDGEKHRVKLGVPTQELMIDGKGYQCFFGGKPITVHLAGKNRTISLDGRPPKVTVGTSRNTDYLLGSIELIKNARKTVTVYLDAKPQRFSIDGKPFVIKFIDAFQAVTINGVRFPVEFGGLPIFISVRGYRQFLRFSSFPDYAIPGQVTVRGMDSEGNTLIPRYPPSPPPYEPSRVGPLPNETLRGAVQPQIDAPRGELKPPVETLRAGPAQPTIQAGRGATVPQLEPSKLGVIPPVDMPRVGAPNPAEPPLVGPPPPSFSLPGVQVRSTAMPPGVVPQPILKPPPPFPPGTTTSASYPPLAPPFQMPLGIISSGPPPMAGIVPGSYLTNAGGAALPQPTGAAMPQPHQRLALPSMAHPPPSTTASLPAVTPAAPASIDLQSLLARLVKTGIIGSSGKKESKKEANKETKEGKITKEEEEEDDEIDDLKDLPPIDVMFDLHNLRKRNNKMIRKMHRGMQCSSCGLRYPTDQTQQYSHHLDWHFRMNKKQQDSTKKVHTRKFYLCFDDWVQYEEIEDLDERVPSMFEVEGQMSTKEENDDEDAEEEILSVAVSSDHSLGVCPICHETFDQFYHHNTEEWHYKYAIHVDGSNYHPGCHQDHLKALKQEEERVKKEAEEEEKLKKEAEEEEERKKALKEEVKEEVAGVGEETKKDDDELEVLKMEDEEIQEIEKVKDEKPKEEIDLTEEDDKMPEIKPEEKDPKQIKDDLVLAVVRKMSLLSNGLPSPLHIKEEPADKDGDMNVILTHKSPPILSDIPIKMEIEEEQEPPSFDIEDDDVAGSEFGGEAPNESWIAPESQNIAHTDIASSIDGNTELLNRQEDSQPSGTVTKIKISVSIPTQNSSEEHVNAANDNVEEENDTENSTEMNNHVEEFVPPPFTVDLELKPLFKGATLRDQPIALRGMEVSSLCSLM